MSAHAALQLAFTFQIAQPLQYSLAFILFQLAVVLSVFFFPYAFQFLHFFVPIYVCYEYDFCLSQASAWKM